MRKRSVSSAVLDASALLALLQNEPGKDVVAAAIAAGAEMSAVNLAEVVTKLDERGLTPAEIQASIVPLGISISDFDNALAYATGLLRAATKAFGLSLGDRACLALAQKLSLPALTTDRAWSSLSLGITVTVIR